MSDSQQQQQQQRGGGRRERFDGNGGDYDKGKRNAEEYPTSALESRKGGMQLRILTALRSEGDA